MIVSSCRISVARIDSRDRTSEVLTLSSPVAVAASPFAACKLEVDIIEPLLPCHDKRDDVDLAGCEEDGDDAKASQGHVVKDRAVTSNKIKHMLGSGVLVDVGLIVTKIAE